MHGEMERIWLATANSELRSEVLALKQKIERLLDAGDALIVALDKGEWYDDVLPAIDNWQEARRG